MKIKVVNAGSCMICGKPIKLVVPRGHNKLLNVCLCRECGQVLKYEKGQKARNKDADSN